MQRSTAALLFASALSALLLTQCAGSAPSLKRVVTVTPEQRTRIQLVQATGPALALQTEALGSRAAVYSDALGDVAAKVVEEADMQTLLDVLAARGFFERAAPVGAPEAREAIVLDHGERRWVWSRRPPTAADDPVFLAFHECRAYVLQLYNQTTAYHTGRNLTGDDLEREQERIRRQREATQRKYEGQNEPKGPPK